ncbi:MAG TPA: hypothetical protein VJ962_04285 [Clostridia bacterium]|nr:hypothetical protein [Clostridia bacterium]
MKEETFCPYCDELVIFEFNDDYYMTSEGDEADVCECPKCHKKVSMSFETSHQYSFSKREDDAS